jgi:hypothetical protein
VAAIEQEDFLTIASIGVLAFVSCDIGHELAGHSGACIATGGHTVSFSTVHYQCSGGWQRLAGAAGILFNVAMGIIYWFALLFARPL